MCQSDSFLILRKSLSIPEGIGHMGIWQIGFREVITLFYDRLKGALILSRFLYSCLGHHYEKNI